MHTGQTFTCFRGYGVLGLLYCVFSFFKCVSGLFSCVFRFLMFIELHCSLRPLDCVLGLCRRSVDEQLMFLQYRSFF